MINVGMKLYDYSTIEGLDEYGQSLEVWGKDKVKMSLYEISNTLVPTIQYTNSTFVGITYDKKVDDTYIIHTDKSKLKVNHVIDFPRYRAVYLGEFDG